jgi:ribosomal protein S27AE
MTAKNPTRESPEKASLQDVQPDNYSGPAARRTKPDPEEPWRYACPECGSAAVFFKGHTNTGEERFECSKCFEWLSRDDLVDKKR